MQRNAPTLALSLCLLAGCCTAVSASAQQQPTSVQVAASSLNLQPGDVEKIAAAGNNPLQFEAIPSEQDFSGELIVHAKKGKVATAEDRIAPITVRTSAFQPQRVVKVPAGMTEGELAAVLMATGDYEFVEPNWTVYPATDPNDPQFGSSWQHNRLQSSDAWDLETGGSDIVVAICDSGVDLDHPDLQDALVPGFNAASNVSQANGGNVDDVNGHGTFVAGCAAAQGNNSRGVTGVGWDFSIMPIRVSNNSDGTASLFAILEGARWAAENGAQIINASFTGATSSGNQSTAVYLKEQGALLFWASGNAGSYISPNRPDYVVVGSTTSSDNRSGFSNYGPAVDVAAPGSSVRSTRRGGSYGNGSGTSYASPIAAGVGAMIFSVNPDFIPDDVQDILYQSVDDLGSPGRDDNFGRGRVNTYNAVTTAMSYVRPTLLPISSSFENSAWQELFVASNGSVETVASGDAPEGASVLRLDHDDVIESSRLAGRTLGNDAIVSFSVRNENLEDGESLLVQYLQNPEEFGEESWATIAEIDGRGLASSEYVRHNIEIPNAMEWHGVQLRFAAGGDDSSDAWFIDDLSLDVISETGGAPLTENFESNNIDPTVWNRTTNSSVAFDAGSYAAMLSDGANLESYDVPLLEFGFTEPYLRFRAWANKSVQSSDELVVEVYTISGTWEAVATINGADLSSSPELQQIDMPLYTWALDNQKVRFTTSTSGAFFLDDIYLGVEELSAGCSDADLAEPYGELNFFDVSAFLSAFSTGGTDADINGDGILNFFDVSEYLTQFNAGCP